MTPKPDAIEGTASYGRNVILIQIKIDKIFKEYLPKVESRQILV